MENLEKSIQELCGDESGAETVCISTKELRSKLQEAEKRGEEKGKVIGCNTLWADGFSAGAEKMKRMAMEILENGQLSPDEKKQAIASLSTEEKGVAK